MNKQKKGDSRGVEWCDQTINPLAGCEDHKCQWKMPNGEIAQCYAKSVAEGGRVKQFYPQGFEHYYWYPERLKAMKSAKAGSKTFVGSMSDVFGRKAPTEHIESILDACSYNQAAHFQILTKNAPRVVDFTIPNNVWLGVSAPPSFMYGKELTINQQHHYIEVALSRLHEAYNPRVRWMSIEPLSFDIAPLMKDCGLDWVVIGAASNGDQTFQPERAWLDSLLNTMDAQGIPVFFKGNLEIRAYEDWREEWPKCLSSS